MILVRSILLGFYIGAGVVIGLKALAVGMAIVTYKKAKRTLV